MEHQGILAADEAVLSSFGYRQELRRALKLFSLYAVAFSVISITTGITLDYSFAIDHFGPAGIWTWLVAGSGQLMVALIIAELGTRMPLTGYAYQWCGRLVTSTYGWFVGFIGLGASVIATAGITLLATAPFVASLFGWGASNPRVVLVVAYVLLLLPVVVNVVGVAVAARINNLAVFTEILGMVVFGVALFVAWAIRAHSYRIDRGLSFLTRTDGVTPLWYGFALAGLLGIFTIIGFELAANLSEEAVNARLTVPRAVIWSVISAVLLGFIALVGFTMALPDVKTPDPVTTVSFWFGALWTKVFLTLVIISIFALTLVVTGAAARLIYALARDNMLPFSRALRKVNRRTRTPVMALGVTLVVTAGFMQYGYLAGGGTSGAFGALIGATSIIAYVVYLMVIVGYAVRRRTLQTMAGEFNLGRWAGPVIAIALVWVVIALGVVTLPRVFRNADYVSGAVVTLAALWYLVVLRRRLARHEAGVDLSTERAPM
jgi:amino acid transporter